MLNGFNDELIVAGQVEERAAGPGVDQLNQRLVYQGVLRKRAINISYLIHQIHKSTLYGIALHAAEQETEVPRLVPQNCRAAFVMKNQPQSLQLFTCLSEKAVYICFIVPLMPALLHISLLFMCLSNFIGAHGHVNLPAKKREPLSRSAHLHTRTRKTVEKR